MNMDEKTIKETLLKGERVTLESKKAKAEVPKIFMADVFGFCQYHRRADSAWGG